MDLPGETEVLVTNLLDAERYPAHEFKALHHKRWGIKEAYKRLKSPIRSGDFPACMPCFPLET